MTGRRFSPHVEREVLSALMDGEVSPSDRRWIHDHLQECELCMQVADEFSSLRGIVTDLPRLVAPEELVAEVMEEPGRGPRGMARRLFRGPRKYVAAAVAAVVVGVSAAGVAAPPDVDPPAVDTFVARHVGVNAGRASGGEVLFAVRGD